MIIMQIPKSHHANLVEMRMCCPDALAGLAASAALAVSDIHLTVQSQKVRVAKIDGKLKINPNSDGMEKASLEFIVAGSLDFIWWQKEKQMRFKKKKCLEAMQFGHEEIKRHCQAQIELTKLVGKEIKRVYTHEKSDPALFERQMRADVYEKLYGAVSKQNC